MAAGALDELQPDAMEFLVKGRGGAPQILGEVIDFGSGLVGGANELPLLGGKLGDAGFESVALVFQGIEFFQGSLFEEFDKIFPEGVAISGPIPSEGPNLHPGNAKGPTAECRGVEGAVILPPEDDGDFLHDIPGFFLTEEQGADEELQRILGLQKETEELVMLLAMLRVHLNWMLHENLELAKNNEKSFSGEIAVSKTGHSSFCTFTEKFDQ